MLILKSVNFLKCFNSSFSEASTKQFLAKRARFWKLEEIREQVLDWESLSDEEKRIHKAHKEAILKGLFTYDDPLTGRKVCTRYKHFLSGSCCGQACRHCTFDYSNVPRVWKKNKHFNSSYWADSPGSKENMEDLFQKIQSSIKVKPK